MASRQNSGQAWCLHGKDKQFRNQVKMAGLLTAKKLLIRTIEMKRKSTPSDD